MTRWRVHPRFPAIEVHYGGKIRRSDDGHLYARWYDSNGRAVVTAWWGGMQHTISIARAVGATFCPEFRESLYVRHRDGRKWNCRASNLEWVSRREVTGVPYSRRKREC